MGIRDNGNGTVTIDYRDANHKRHRETITGGKTMAKNILAKIKANIVEGKFFPQKQQNALTFCQAADKYWELHLSKKKCAPKTKYTLEFIKKYFGNKRLKDITSEDILQFYNQRVKESSVATANRHLTTLRAVINKVIKLKLYRGENPCDGVSKEKEPPARMVYLTKEQIMDVMTYIPTRSLNLFLLAILTGMRQGEIVNLDWQDIDLQNDVIHVYKSKSDKPRDIPIVPYLKEILLNMLPQKSGKVFWLSVKQMNADFKEALRQAGIENVRFHDLRHTFASHLVMLTGNLYLTSRALGHSDLRMTQRYAHLDRGYMYDTVKALDNVVPKIEE